MKTMQDQDLKIIKKWAKINYENHFHEHLESPGKTLPAIAWRG